MIDNVILSEMNNKSSPEAVLNDRFSFPDSTNEFILKKFKNRICYKFKKEGDSCVCNKAEIDHKEKSKNGEEWSYDNNTTLNPCNIYGFINFTGYDYIPQKDFPKFIAFDCLEDCQTTCESVFQLLTEKDPWKTKLPKLIISINGGLKRMKFVSKLHKKNFKQGLIDIIKKDQTWVIGGGVNIGIHKLVGQTISEFRLQHEDMKEQVSLIGISSWGTICNNNQLKQLNESNQKSLRLSRLFKYENKQFTEKKQVCLSDLYDYFLFCDDGSERQYDKEIEFRMKFENYIKKEADGFLVQILFEGGKRAVKNAYNALNGNVPLLVMKGSGRVANLISEVMELPNNKNTLKNGITKIVKENSSLLEIPEDGRGDSERDMFTDCFFEMYTRFQKKIVIYDMMDTNVKFDKKILEAMIIGADKSLDKTLKLCIRFNCPNIAEKFVFSDPKYNTMKLDFINTMFMSSVKDNKPEFVNLFLENNFEVDKFLSADILRELYQISFDPDKCRCAELLCDLINDTSFFRKRKKNNRKEEILFNVDIILQKLSGYMLVGRYKYLFKDIKKYQDIENKSFQEDDAMEYEDEVNMFNMHDLFLWSVLSGRSDLSQIIWRSGVDHIGTALIGCLIYKTMAELVLIRGDHNFQQKLTEASVKFENLALSIISESYNTSKTKTSLLIIRELRNWDNLTCLQIATIGDMLEFLNHSACRSHTTKIWMGDISPFLSTWKIVLAIPFSIFMMKSIFPPFSNKKTVTKTNFQNNQLISPKENAQNTFDAKQKGQPVSFCNALQKFYRAPIVKFSIHVFSYIIFLAIFSYMNLVELKPFNKVKNIFSCFAEIYTCIYVVTFTIEEFRQVLDEEICGFSYKLMSHFSGVWNRFDALSILMFFISVISRCLIQDPHFMICRCLFAITLSMFFLRSMQFYFASKSIGPKVIMIGDMLRDILFFLSIFIIFLLAYGTLAHALKNPNSNFEFGLFKDIVYFPYFQTYGELMLENFQVSESCNGTDCFVKGTVVIFSFGIFLLLTNVLLINLLIAMFGYTFNQIQDDSEKLWCFIRIQLVQEFYRRPILPPPFNVIYYCLKLLFLPCKKSSQFLEQKENLLVKTLDRNENYKMCVYEQLCHEALTIESNSQNVSNTGITSQEMNSMIETIEKLKYDLSVIGNINETSFSFKVKK